MPNETVELLRELTEASGISGYEEVRTQAPFTFTAAGCQILSLPSQPGTSTAMPASFIGTTTIRRSNS